MDITEPLGPGPASPNRETLIIFDFLKMENIEIDRFFSFVVEPQERSNLLHLALLVIFSMPLYDVAFLTVLDEPLRRTMPSAV
jgi:hypothetical protein